MGSGGRRRAKEKEKAKSCKDEIKALEEERETAYDSASCRLHQACIASAGAHLFPEPTNITGNRCVSYVSVVVSF